jgi:hypothetical protein
MFRFAEHHFRQSIPIRNGIVKVGMRVFLPQGKSYNQWVGKPLSICIRKAAAEYYGQCT